MVPACAGVIPDIVASQVEFLGGSRMCGGDPKLVISNRVDGKWFPHVRG